jgi:multidrug efflux pump subunit AcrB
MVRYPRDQRNSQRDLLNVRIRLADGTEAPLSTVARTIESRSYSEINRVDGHRIVSVSGKVDSDVMTQTEATAIIDDDVIPALVKEFPGLRVTKAGFSQDQVEDLGAMVSALAFALVVMYALLAAELKSYIQPLIIGAGIPAGMAGAVIGHLLLGYDLSFISIFGMIALTGVVVNDSLVMIDRYNIIRRTTDNGPAEAIVLAAQRRFRAIFLTTATTALGLTPMLFERSISAQFLIPMAVSLAVGIVFASVVILFVVPALVGIVEEDLYPFLLRRSKPSVESHASEQQASAPIR